MSTHILYPHADIRVEAFGGIVFNSSGVLVELDKADTELYILCIKDWENVDALKAYNEKFSLTGLQKLLAARYLSFQKDNAKHRIIEYSDRAEIGFLNAPISAHIYPSFCCNAKCFFCYNETQEQNNSKKDVDIDCLIKIIDYLYDIGVPSINFLGGEPLLYYDKLIEALRYCNNKFFIGMASNGVGDCGFTKERCKELSKIKNLYVRISLHHFIPSIHDEIVNLNGAFSQAMESIDNLLSAGVHCIWSCLPLRDNKNDIVEMINYAKKMNMSGFHLLNPHPTNTFMPQHPLWLSQEEKMTIINQIQSLESDNEFEISFSNWYYRLKNENNAVSMCGAGNEMIEIDDKGNCYPCCIVIGNSAFKMGNILVGNMNTERLKMVQRLYEGRMHGNLFNNQCRNCSYKMVCAGGCPLANYIMYGSINESDKECPYQ